MKLLMNRPSVLAVLLCLGLHGSLRAEPVAELQTFLQSRSADQHVRARLELEFTQQNEGSVGTPEPGRVQMNVAFNGDGLQVIWDRALLEGALAEAQLEDPDQPRPLARALAQVDALDVAQYLDAAPRLLTQLRSAKLTGTVATEWQGQSAQRLDFAVDPPLGRQAKKYVKDLDASMSLWLDANGVPLASERKIRVKGRAMMVISFESNTEERYEYLHDGERLLVSRYERRSNDSGGGESGSSVSIAKLSLLPDDATQPGDAEALAAP